MRNEVHISYIIIVCYLLTQWHIKSLPTIPITQAPQTIVVFLCIPCCKAVSSFLMFKTNDPEGHNPRSCKVFDMSSRTNSRFGNGCNQNYNIIIFYCL